MCFESVSWIILNNVELEKEGTVWGYVKNVCFFITDRVSVLQTDWGWNKKKNRHNKWRWNGALSMKCKEGNPVSSFIWMGFLTSWTLYIKKVRCKKKKKTSRPTYPEQLQEHLCLYIHPLLIKHRHFWSPSPSFTTRSALSWVTLSIDIFFTV